MSTPDPDMYVETLKSELFLLEKRATSLINEIVACDTSVASTGLRERYSIPSVLVVIQTVSELWEISPDRMLKRTKYRPSAEARFAAMSLIRYMFNLPRTTVGMVIGERTVSDVSHSLNRNIELLSIDPVYALRYRSAEDVLSKQFGLEPVIPAQFPHTRYRLSPRK